MSTMIRPTLDAGLFQAALLSTPVTTGDLPELGGPALPPSLAMGTSENPAPTPMVPGEILERFGVKLWARFEQYKTDRTFAEETWLRNLRQYRGVYDPEIDQQLSKDRSRAYPRLTRVKVLSTLGRVMNLIFPGNERNWTLQPSPDPDLPPEVAVELLRTYMSRMQEAGTPVELSDETLHAAMLAEAHKRAGQLSTLIDDQLQELGGDQTLDYVALSRKVILSGLLYGMGLLWGPFVRKETQRRWTINNGVPQQEPRVVYKPLYEFLPVWDFYPDMQAKSVYTMDGYFVRRVMTRSMVRQLRQRTGFHEAQIDKLMRQHPDGNYKPLTFEQQLRTMGRASTSSEQRAERGSYEILTWYGTMSGRELQELGAAIPSDQLEADLEAEVWLSGNVVLKADLNPWRQAGMDVRMVHAFLFDEDDTSLVPEGLPNVIRDSQMSMAAATRMMLDNASVVCGPNLEVNHDLLLPQTDVTGAAPWKVWHREGTGIEAQFPAVRELKIDAHLPELQAIVSMFREFADAETFVGPATGGDMDRMPSEPMRTAAGASMLRGDVALPFKDIVRNVDLCTQSLIQSLVQFNRQFNPEKVPDGDYNVIARGATSLIAKEVRGLQIDGLVGTMQPAEWAHVNKRKLIEARFASRDLQDLLLPEHEVQAIEQAMSASQREAEALQQRMIQAEVRKTLADAFKAITQGQKNAAAADAAAANTALEILNAALGTEATATEGASNP